MDKENKELLEGNLRKMADILEDVGEILKVSELDAAKHVWIAEDNIYQAIEELNTLDSRKERLLKEYHNGLIDKGAIGIRID